MTALEELHEIDVQLDEIFNEPEPKKRARTAVELHAKLQDLKERACNTDEERDALVAVARKLMVKCFDFPEES